jgi:hypothetical protein
MPYFIFIFISLFIQIASSKEQHHFKKGFNQAWMKNDYAHQWENAHYDPIYADKLLKLTRDSNAKILRLWIFEGSWQSQFLKTKNFATSKIKPEILFNLRHFLRLARQYNVQISLTFLDGNSFKYVLDKPDLKNFWWNIFNNKYDQLDEFYRNAIFPVYKLIHDEFKDVVTQIDLVNEVNAINEFGLFENGKESLSYFLCRIKTGSPTKTTASLGWANAEELYFNGLLNQSCLDFFDIHLYNDQGRIPRCLDYKELSLSGIEFQLGEFGQSSALYDDSIQEVVTLNFLKEAHDCGFTSALAWRLFDQRPFPNPDERFSFFNSYGPRPAYKVFKNFRN